MNCKKGTKTPCSSRFRTTKFKRSTPNNITCHNLTSQVGRNSTHKTRHLSGRTRQFQSKFRTQIIVHFKIHPRKKVFRSNVKVEISSQTRAKRRCHNRNGPQIDASRNKSGQVRTPNNLTQKEHNLANLNRKREKLAGTFLKTRTQ